MRPLNSDLDKGRYIYLQSKRPYIWDLNAYIFGIVVLFHLFSHCILLEIARSYFVLSICGTEAIRGVLYKSTAFKGKKNLAL